MKNVISEFIQISLAIVLASIGLKAFLLPNGFLDGGVTGLSILISKLFSIDLAIVLPVATIPFFIMGWFTLSRRILLKSVLSVILLSLFIHFENFQSITEDKLIICIFGGIFLGAGIGMAIKNGSVLDGSEILGIYVNERWGISIGTTILILNLALFGVTAIVISVETALYSILTYFVTAKVIDFVIQGFEDYVGLMVVSKNSEKMQERLLNEIGQGMTIYGGIKGFGSQGKQENMEVIHTVLNRIDTKRAYKIIESEDKEAFVIEFDVNHVKGGVLRKYLSKKSKRQLDTSLFSESENGTAG